MGLNVAWATLLSQFGGDSGGNVYVVLGPFALVVSVAATVAAMRPGAAGGWFSAGVAQVATGVGLGLVMVLLTYPAFDLATAWFPWLEPQVERLYQESRCADLSVALLWTTVIMFAEEIVWRGVWLDVLGARLGTAPAATLSVLAYAAAQLGSGSWVVCLLALVCGSVWTLLRLHTRSLLPPLIAHAIWTPTVILLHPVV